MGIIFNFSQFHTADKHGSYTSGIFKGVKNACTPSLKPKLNSINFEMSHKPSKAKVFIIFSKIISNKINGISQCTVLIIKSDFGVLTQESSHIPLTEDYLLAKCGMTLIHMTATEVCCFAKIKR